MATMRPATAEDFDRVRDAVAKLCQARDLLAAADCPKASNAVRRALKSAEGAERHIRHRAAASIAAREEQGCAMRAAGVCVVVARNSAAQAEHQRRLSTPTLVALIPQRAFPGCPSAVGFLLHFLCSCKRGVQRDNCPACEGTGWVIDFAAIRRRAADSRAPAPVEHSPAPWRRDTGVGDCIIAADGQLVAQVRGAAGPAPYEAAAGDLRLMIEAPAMFDLLQRFVSGEGRTVNPNLSARASHKENLDDARALLARVNGEA